LFSFLFLFYLTFVFVSSFHHLLFPTFVFV
jgi:hypothetical protein